MYYFYDKTLYDCLEVPRVVKISGIYCTVSLYWSTDNMGNPIVLLCGVNYIDYTTVTYQY